MNQPFSMLIDGVYMIEGRGCIATGKIQGKVSIGDEVEISGLSTVVTSIETSSRFVEYAAEDGCFVGLVLRGINSEQISVGKTIKKIQNKL